MAKATTIYICQQCGYQSPSYLGRCPNCQTWGSLVETLQIVKQPSGRTRSTRSTGRPSVEPVKLSEIKASELERSSTGIFELDRVLGGGIVPGMAVLIAGDPGIGKSTLLLELSRNRGDTLGKQSKSRDKDGVLYVAGEESASQIKIRAERLGIKTDNILIAETTDVDQITSLLDQKSAAPSLVIVDSIQTLATSDLVGQAGSVGQVRECAARLISSAKPEGTPVFLVGHVTKEGAIAGPKVLEHLVDTVLYFEGERFENLRLLRVTKNRFGPTDEVGVFNMTDSGVKEVQSPNWIGDHASLASPGSCPTVVMEGTRPMIVEIQSLTTATPLPYPRRVATGVDNNRLQMIIAVLQKRLNLPLYKEDVFVSASGGVKVEEPAVDLPIALSIISSYNNKPLPRYSVAFGELDLLGNIRRVHSSEKRVKEARKLGFKNVLWSETLSTLNKFHL